MHPCNVSQLIEIISGDPADARCDSSEVRGASIDTRTIKPGDVFFALPGERSHGILFADEAIAKGASCVVTDFASASQSAMEKASRVIRLQSPDTYETDCRIVRVPNAIKAMQKLAMWNRQQFQGLVIGITGSVGKTTTREMIASVLSSQFHGLQSPRNFNNELGVPLSLIQISPEHDFAVLELAAGRQGDIAFLAEMSLPEFAVVTKVGAAHLESFGSLDAIQKTKQELPEAVASGGTVFLNADDPLVREMASATTAHVSLFGLAADADVRATNVTARDGRCSFAVDGIPYEINGSRHLLTAALAAIAIGRVTGVADSQMVRSLSEFQPDAGRGRIVQQAPWTVVDDSYNASPSSVHAAISALADWQTARHRVLVLGDMLELGENSEKLHFEVGRALATSKVDHVLILGNFADAVYAGAKSTGMLMNRISVFHEISTLQTMLDCILTVGDVVWIKGSRSMRMERVVRWLQDQVSEDQRRNAA